ncbi:hypothetical protein [Corynebacterium silvaticum]|uniref:Uncharacterized protein n=1 Tax=Corynebacterium silvaticum TaxID=2320431 RepID=A0A7U5HMW4_9CORY|nr:hypothetical protein [Corynebacterium silvaticum]ARU46730.1 hypothetical protein CBE74_10020 [Corynebacterium silvaticum]
MEQVIRRPDPVFVNGFQAGVVEEIFFADVFPMGATTFDDQGDGVNGGNTRQVQVQVQVLAAAGTPINEGDELVIRGLSYRVIHIPWDWATGRTPALASHRPPHAGHR